MTISNFCLLTGYVEFSHYEPLRSALKDSALGEFMGQTENKARLRGRKRDEGSGPLVRTTALVSRIRSLFSRS